MVKQDNDMLMQIPNPFLGDIYTDAWSEAPTDVVTINQEAYSILWRSFEHVIQMGGNRSVLVEAPPGAGKTHLIGRLRKALACSNEDSAEPTKAVLIHVQLKSNPELLWQHLRKVVTDNLLQQTRGLSQLQRLVAHQFAEAEGSEPKKWTEKFRLTEQLQPKVIEAQLDQMVTRRQLHSEVGTVVGHLVRGAYVRSARAWLRGEYVSAENKAVMGINPDSESITCESNSQELVTALLSLASVSLPIVLCFDQIEAIERYNGDGAALFTFGRLFADIYNDGHNLLLISCIQSSFLANMQTNIRGADFERLTQSEASLRRLTKVEAESLLVARMDAISELKKLRDTHKNNPLWPLTKEQTDTVFRDDAVPWTARNLLGKASRWFDECAHRPIVDLIDKNEALAEEFKRLIELDIDSDTDAIVLHGLPLMCGIHGVEWVLDQKPEKPKDINLVLENGAEQVDIAVINASDGRTIRHPLKRLADRKEHTPVVILRDAEYPIPLTDTIKKSLQKIEGRGGKIVRLEAEALAVLQAARSLLSDARAGDLSIQGQAIDVGSVSDWLSNNLYESLRPVMDLFDQLGSESSAATIDLTVERFKMKMEEEKVVELQVLASQLESPPEMVEDLARSCPETVGILEGPPVVLFALRAKKGQEGRAA